MTEKEKLAAYRALQYQLNVCDASVDWLQAHIKELRAVPYPKDIREQALFDNKMKTLMGKLAVEHRLHAAITAKYEELNRD